MHLEVKVKLTSPILGSKRSSRKGKALVRDWTNENIATDIPRLDWAIREAAIALDMEDVIRPNMIHASPIYAKPTTHVYERNVRRNGVPKLELHECINTGTVLTWVFTLTEAPPGTPGRKHLLRPTEEQLKQLLGFIGENLGMSQWGNNLGFGRFVIYERPVVDNNETKIPKSIYNDGRRDDVDRKQQ